MVPSPRKRAPSATTRPAFNQTWDDNDAAFLDTGSLPLPKIPRGWERKQEVKKVGEGREKKIWRRFNLRSRAPNATGEEEEEEHDSRSRAVKKLQRMSPKAMEKTTAGPNSKKRTFKATRWDRRKSVLPRKKIARMDDAPVDEMSGTEDDVYDAPEGDSESFAEPQAASELAVERPQSLLPEAIERRSTFTFTMDAPTVDDLPDYESLDGYEQYDQHPNSPPAEEATLANLFRSPVKRNSTDLLGSPKKVSYPELPHSDDQETTTTEIINQLDPATEDTQHPCKNGRAQDYANNLEADEIITEPQTENQACDNNQEDHEQSPATTEMQTTSTEVTYPTLPTSATGTSTTVTTEVSNDECEDTEMSDISLDFCPHDSVPVVNDPSADLTPSLEGEAPDEEFTEASLQFNIQREYEETLQKEQWAPVEAQEQQKKVGQAIQEEATSKADVSFDFAASKLHESLALQHLDTADMQPVDIADGLTLAFTPAKPPSADPTPRKLHSPPPPPRSESGPDDVTMTIAIDDDTAILKDFLSRAAANRAEKAAIVTHRRESVQNRRDSDVIRHALASPRKVLEEKDPNSPSKHDMELTLDLSQTLTLNVPGNALVSPTPDQAHSEGMEDEKSLRGSRRSSRTKKSRLPAPASAAQTQASKIAIRRADGNEVVVLKKNDTQELATLTRANTRKNKQGAFGVTVRLLKLAVDAAGLPPIDDSTKELVVGKNIRWDEQLVYYQENPETVANLLAEAESLSTPDELSMSDSSTTSKAKNKTSKSSTPKIRRVRGLGTANGTPGKGLLASTSLLPEAVQEEKEVAQTQTQQLPKPKVSKIKKMPVAPTSIDSSVSSSVADTKLPTLDVAPVGIQPAAQRKSRLAAPKKVMLPQPLASIAAEGKENTQRPGLGDATPKKGIPAPKVIVPPTAGMESGLPRRRGRKY
ncbi:hypothetical protein BKA66DRAFT_433545 [Pyrenochaeta sp. MPI-SDFR-AT-0127]|nr:hypothetical protein BKA66DRAFT_433545 [Pyrenochaeta sp. MPI-SDFR-AT-0127]